jgi:glycerophosphoryl diester phosphodiesterase
MARFDYDWPFRAGREAVMQLFAHRGYHLEAPENSLAAFEAAVRIGVTGIETDVRLSRDGLPVIIHDRVTPLGRAVSELTRMEIEQDVGHPVPILSELLDSFPDVCWNIEIKTPEAWPAAANVLAQFQSNRDLFITSFRHDVVRLCAEQLAIECGLLIAHRPLDVGALMLACKSHAPIRAIVWDYNVIDDGVLQTVSTGGWRNFVYGAVTPVEHDRCRSLDLAGVITDYPLLLGGEKP